MPPPLNRFPTGPTTISPYHQQYPAHAQHAAAHPPPLGAAQAYLNTQVGQVNPYAAANSNLLGMAGGLNTGTAGFGVGADAGLASHAGRMGFAHAAGLQQPQQAQQQQQQQQQLLQQQHVAQHAQAAQSFQHAQHLQHQAHSLADHTIRVAQNKGRIREVWKHNLHEEMAVLRELVDKYPYIAMDTEFPGVVSRPMGGFRGKSDYHYQCLRTNVDMLKVIQIGIALFNENGEQPPARPSPNDPPELRRAAANGPLPYAWQFNFKFSLKDDMYNQTSIESLQQAGIDFSLLERDGIDPHEFASLLIPSGLVCFDDVRWISFHGGYDFGYLTKLLVCRQLPGDEVEFDQLMKLYFPCTYDVKHLMKHAIKLHNSGMLTPSDPGTTEILQKFEQKSGLENIADVLKLKRIGSAHQAGSDGLLTGRVFFELRKRIFNGEISDEHLGKVWGLGIPDWSINPGVTLGNPNNTNPGNAGVSNNANANNTDKQAETNGNANNASGANQNGACPSTPNTGNSGLANSSNTPAVTTNGNNSSTAVASAASTTTGGGAGPMTPGGGGGVFGQFAYGGNAR